MHVRSWIRRNPQPAAVRLDGVKVVPIAATGATRWADVMSVITSTDPARIEALDASGQVLRACDLHDQADEDAAAAAPATERMTELVLLGQELRKAADESAARHEAFVRYAFETMASITSSVVNRSASIENAYMKLLEAHAERMQSAPGEDAAMMQIMGPALAAVAGGKAGK
jgi:hypothetical protein